MKDYAAERNIHINNMSDLDLPYLLDHIHQKIKWHFEIPNILWCLH